MSKRTPGASGRNAVSNEIQMEDITTVDRHVMEWFEVASKNAQCAVILSKKPGSRKQSRFRKQSLYMTQQSMETATKGLASVAGVSYEEIRKLRHNNLRIFFLFMERVLAAMQSVDYISAVLSSHSADNESYDAAAEISNMLNLTSDPRNRGKLSKSQKESATRFYNSMMALPPQDVDLMLQLLSTLRATLRRTPDTMSLIKYMANKTFVMDPYASYDDIAKSIAGQVIERNQSHKTSRNLNEAEVALVEKMCQHMMKRMVDGDGDKQFRLELKENNGEFTLPSSSFVPVVKHSLDLQAIHLGILIVGSLVWLHESSPRYPPDPDAPDSAEEAVAQGKMGARHYTDDRGVIKHVRTLALEAQKTTDLLKKRFKGARK